jgi:hypothetical protein
MRELLARLRRAGCAEGDDTIAQVHCAVCKASSERARAAAAQEVARSEEALLALVAAMSGGADAARNDATTALLTIAKAGPECKSAITRHPRVLSALASAVSGEVRSSRCALAVIGFVIGPSGSSSTHATARRVGKAEGMFDALAGALAAADCGVSGLAASAIAMLCNALPGWLQRVRRNDGGAFDAALAALRSGVGPSAELVALATQGSSGCAARVAADSDALRVLCVMAAGGVVTVIAGCPASAAGALASLIKAGHAASVEAASEAVADAGGGTAQRGAPGEVRCVCTHLCGGLKLHQNILVSFWSLSIVALSSALPMLRCQCSQRAM